MKKILSAICLSAMLYSPSSYAVCDGCVVGAVNAAAASIVSAVGTVTAAVNLGTERIVGAISGSMATASSSAARSAEMTTQGALRGQVSIEQARQDDRYQVPDACAVLSPTATGEAARTAPGNGTGQGRGGGGKGAPKDKGVTGDMKKSLEIAAGGSPVPTPEAQAKFAVSGACSTFVNADANKQRAEACSLGGFSVGSANGHPDADIRAETLFDGPQRAGEFRRILTIDGDSPQASAQAAYLRNLNTPMDLRDLRKGELQSDMGRQYMAYRDAYEARMSLAEKPARGLVMNRTARRDFLPIIKELTDSPVTGAFVKNYLNKNFAAWASKGISLDEMTNLEAERRYMNPSWHVLMAASPPEVHVKEQTAMLAYQTVLMARMLEKLDQQAVLTGQTVATQVRQEMMPQLVQLHGAASK